MSKLEIKDLQVSVATEDGPEALMRAGDDMPGAPRTTRRVMRRRRGI